VSAGWPMDARRPGAASVKDRRDSAGKVKRDWFPQITKTERNAILGRRTADRAEDVTRASRDLHSPQTRDDSPQQTFASDKEVRSKEVVSALSGSSRGRSAKAATALSSDKSAASSKARQVEGQSILVPHGKERVRKDSKQIPLHVTNESLFSQSGQMDAPEVFSPDEFLNARPEFSPTPPVAAKFERAARSVSEFESGAGNLQQVADESLPIQRRFDLDRQSLNVENQAPKGQARLPLHLSAQQNVAVHAGADLPDGTHNGSIQPDVSREAASEPARWPVELEGADTTTKISRAGDRESFARKSVGRAVAEPVRRVDGSARTVSGRSDEAQDAAPDLHINIGRIDVKAAAPPAARPAARVRGLALPLDEYLKRRQSQSR
jgi:hypothetical protein